MPKAFDASRLEALRDTMTAENFVRLVRLFGDDLGLRLGLLDRALREGDRAATQATAHAIRGLAGNMGAVVLSALAAAMEADAASASPQTQATRFDALLAEALATQAALDRMMS